MLTACTILFSIWVLGVGISFTLDADKFLTNRLHIPGGDWEVIGRFTLRQLIWPYRLIRR